MHGNVFNVFLLPRSARMEQASHTPAESRMSVNLHIIYGLQYLKTSVICVVFPIWYFLLFIAFHSFCLAVRVRDGTNVGRAKAMRRPKYIGGRRRRCTANVVRSRFTNSTIHGIYFMLLKFGISSWFIVPYRTAHTHTLSDCRFFCKVSILANVIPTTAMICSRSCVSVCVCSSSDGWVSWRRLCVCVRAHFHFYACNSTLSNTCTGQNKWEL